MNTKRLLGGWIAVFIFIFVFEWIFHGMIMKAMYQQTASLWRPEAEMKRLFHWLVIGQLFVAFAFSYIFTKGYENKGIVEGIRYGILIGLLFSGPNLIMYAVAPYPSMMIVRWIAGGIFEFAVAGAVIAAVYRPSRS